MLQPLRLLLLDCLYSPVTAYRGLFRTLRVVLAHPVQLPIKKAVMLQTVACVGTGRIRLKAGQTSYTLHVFLLVPVCTLDCVSFTRYLPNVSKPRHVRQHLPTWDTRVHPRGVHFASVHHTQAWL